MLLYFFGLSLSSLIRLLSPLLLQGHRNDTKLKHLVAGVHRMAEIFSAYNHLSHPHTSDGDADQSRQTHTGPATVTILLQDVFRVRHPDSCLQIMQRPSTDFLARQDAESSHTSMVGGFQDRKLFRRCMFLDEEFRRSVFCGSWFYDLHWWRNFTVLPHTTYAPSPPYSRVLSKPSGIVEYRPLGFFTVSSIP